MFFAARSISCTPQIPSYEISDAKALLGRCAALALLLVPAAHAQDAVSRGLRLMSDPSGGNCIACHALPGQTGVLSSFGPALAGVGSRYSAEQLRQWVSDARVIKPNTLMPPFGTTQGARKATAARPILEGAEIDKVVAALQTLR